jgi:general secretion pathway protein D
VGSSKTGLGFPDLITQGTQYGTGQGLTALWQGFGDDVLVMLRLLSAKTDVNILSTPTLYATDNKEATINVGGREPVRVGQTTTSGGNVTENIQYEDTGIILTVTPHINAGGLVRMEVEQTIRRVASDTTEGIQSPRFDERKVNTSLLAQDGQTVVIGGIIQETNDTTESGVPYLKRLPILGALFSATRKEKDRVELIIAITPKIIKQYQDQEITQEFLYKLKDLKERIQGF